MLSDKDWRVDTDDQRNWYEAWIGSPREPRIIIDAPAEMQEDEPAGPSSFHPPTHYEHNGPSSSYHPQHFEQGGPSSSLAVSDAPPRYTYDENVEYLRTFMDSMRSIMGGIQSTQEDLVREVSTDNWCF